MADNYNHNRPLSYFREQIDFLIANGVKPIAVTQMYCDDTFVFETEEQAEEAYNLCLNKYDGYFYGKKEFLRVVNQYQKNTNSYVLIYWINLDNKSYMKLNKEYRFLNKEYRFKENPQEKIFHDKFIEMFDRDRFANKSLSAIIFGWKDDCQNVPVRYLTDEEEIICLNMIQWLGSSVGQSFLNECGFVLKEDKK